MWTPLKSHDLQLRSQLRSRFLSMIRYEPYRLLHLESSIIFQPVASEIEQVEKELAHSSERFRKPKTLSVTNDTESARIPSQVKTNAKKLVFQNIQAVVLKKKGVRQEILKKIDGVARPGELTFIMGSSGAGKTTLLNILTGRNLKNIETDGDIMINGLVGFA